MVVGGGSVAPGFCGDCRATFAGRQSHCKVCHQTFAANRPGDNHRKNLKCRSLEEMRAIGLWQDSEGIWHGETSKGGVPKRQAKNLFTPGGMV